MTTVKKLKQKRINVKKNTTKMQINCCAIEIDNVLFLYYLSNKRDIYREIFIKPIKQNNI